VVRHFDSRGTFSVIQHRPSTTVKSATRVAAGDDRTSYDTVSIALHWATVILVLMQFALSQICGFVPRPTRHLLIVTHMSFGMLLSAVIVVRILWRVSPRHQAPVSSAGWVELAAKAIHYLLYALLVSEAVLGFLLRWSGNESMSFFGLEIAPPFAPFSKAVHHNIGEAPEFTGWTIILVAAAHAGAALFHHFVVRDTVLLRMLPRIRRR